MSADKDVGALAAALDHEPKCECGEQRYCGTPKACAALFRLADENRSRLADGTAPGTKYQPMPGDLVSIDCRGIDPKFDQHGTRLGTVERMTYAHGEEGVCVRLPGWAFTLCVDVGYLELVRR